MGPNGLILFTGLPNMPNGIQASYACLCTLAKHAYASSKYISK